MKNSLAYKSQIGIVKKALFSGLLLLLSSVVMADSTTPTLTAASVVNHTDLAMTYLAMVFGKVGNVLHGTSGDMLGHLFYKFNQGVVVIAAIILSYTAMINSFRAASEATFTAPNRNTQMIVVRVAVGFGLLLPAAGSGYNILQVLMMKVVQQSVVLADTTWSYGLDYVQNGGSVWHVPLMQTSGGSGIMEQAYLTKLLGPYVDRKSLTPAPATVNTVQGITPAKCTPKGTCTGFLQKIVQNEACMYENEFGNSGAISTPLDPVVNSGGNLINFPSSRKASDVAGCGDVDLSAIAKQMKISTKQTQTFMMPIVTDLLPAAKSYVCSLDDNSGKMACIAQVAAANGDSRITKFERYQTAANALYSAFLDYSNRATQAQRQTKNEKGNKMLAFIPRAKREGWAMAGSYYWDLARLESAYDSASSLSNFVDKDAVSMGTVNNLDAFKEELKYYSVLAYSDLYYATEAYQKGSTSAATYTGTQAGVEAASGFLSIFLGPFWGVLTDMSMIYTSFGTQTSLGINVDPILWLYQLGAHFINLAADLIVSAVIGFFAILLPFSICKGQVDAQTPLKEGLEWIKPIIVGAAAMFFTLGFTLQYMVPMYPYMVFTFGVVGWLIIVIEAMVAAPLVAMSLTHPEGHELLGKGEQAIMLALSVFVRPVLMVIGLIAGMILSFVSLRIAIWSYGSFIFDLFHPDSGSAGTVQLPTGDDPILAGAAMATLNISGSQMASPYGWLIRLFLTTPLLFFIFASLVYQLVQQCYNMIFILPDYLLRWIGAPTQPLGQTPGQMAGAVMSVGSEVASQASSTTRDAVMSKIKAGQDAGGGSMKSTIDDIERQADAMENAGDLESAKALRSTISTLKKGSDSAKEFQKNKNKKSDKKSDDKGSSSVGDDAGSDAETTDEGAGGEAGEGGGKSGGMLGKITKNAKNNWKKYRFAAPVGMLRDGINAAGQAAASGISRFGGAVADSQPIVKGGEYVNKKAAEATNTVFGGVKAVAKGVVKLGKTGPKRLVDWLRGK